jgi:hypothetical protein
VLTVYFEFIFYLIVDTNGMYQRKMVHIVTTIVKLNNCT